MELQWMDITLSLEAHGLVENPLLASTKVLPPYQPHCLFSHYQILLPENL